MQRTENRPWKILWENEAYLRREFIKRESCAGEKRGEGKKIILLSFFHR